MNFSGDALIAGSMWRKVVRQARREKRPHHPGLLRHSGEAPQQDTPDSRGVHFYGAAEYPGLRRIRYDELLRGALPSGSVSEPGLPICEYADWGENRAGVRRRQGPG